MVLIEKDKHLKEAEPFFSAIKDYHNCVLDQEFNNENTTYISLGDLFHSSLPTPKEYDEMERFLNSSKFRKIYLIAGNHDYSGSKKSYSILPLQNNPRVKLVLEPTLIGIEHNSYLMLPHLPGSKMKQVYENLPGNLSQADYILYHFEDETIQYGGHKNGINISYLRGKRIGGHIHKSQTNYELGMPVLSRYDERGDKNTLFSIENNVESFIEIPKFLDYYSVEYGQELPAVEAKYPIWDVLNAPSTKLVDMKDSYIHKIEVVKKDKNIETKSASRIEDFLNNYISNRDDIIDWAKIRLRDLIVRSAV